MKKNDEPRWDKIRAARLKIARGEYERPEVLAEAIDKLMKEVQEEEDRDLFNRHAR